MRTTAANYRGGIASLLAGTQALGRGMDDLARGTYGFTPQGRREAELRRMLDEAMKKRAGMDIDAANAPPPPDPRLAGLPRTPFPVDAPLAPPVAPTMPVKTLANAGMPAPPAPPKGAIGGFPLVGGAAPGVFAPPPMTPPPSPVGMPDAGGPPGPGGLTPDDEAMLGQTGLGSLLGMSGPKGGSPATTPAQGAAEALTIAKKDPFAAGPLAAPPPADPFGGERKGLLLDRAIATLQKNPGQASAMTDRLLGRAQEDTPDAIRADIEILGGLDGSPEGYRSAMPQMRSNLGRKELFGMITEGINRKRTEASEAEKFSRQKELKRMEEEGATGRTKMTVDAQKDVAATRAAATLEGNLARIIAAKQKVEGKPILTAKDYLSMERSLLREAEGNAQATYSTMADSRGFPKEGFTEDDVKMARDAWMGAQAAQRNWDAQAALRRWEKEYVAAAGEAAPATEGPAAAGGEPSPTAPATSNAPPPQQVPPDAKAKAQAILARHGGDRAKAEQDPEYLALKASLGGQVTKSSGIITAPATPSPSPSPRPVPRKALGMDLDTNPQPEWKDTRTEDQILAEVEAAIQEQKRLPLQSQDIEGAIRRIIERPLAREAWERKQGMEQGRQAGEAHRSALADIEASKAEKAAKTKRASADEAKQWLTKVRGGM